MVWNIEFQFAALIITAVIAIMLQGQKRLNYQAENAYIRLLVAVMASTLFDILSVLAINYMDSLPEIAVQISCELYLFSIAAVAFVASCYIVVELKHDKIVTVKFLLLIPLVVLLFTLLGFKTSILFDETTKEVFSYGVTVNTTYGVCFLYILCMLFMNIYLRKQINKTKRNVFFFWLGAWIFAALVQLFNPQLLLISFAMSVACIYMYSRIENPGYLLETSVNVFNRRGFRTLAEESLRLRQHLSLYAISIDNFDSLNENLGNKNNTELVSSVCNFLSDNDKHNVFRLEDNLFCITFDKNEEMSASIDKTISRMKKPFEVAETEAWIAYTIVYIDDIDTFVDVDSLEEMIHYFSAVARNEGVSPFRIDEEQLDKRKRKIEIQKVLEKAIDEQNVEMFYQPIYNIKAGRFSSMEALVRVKDDMGKMFMPGEFIEYAEKNGMIIRLGEIIFRKVCAFIKYSNIEQYGIEYIEVNLSAVQCMQEDLARLFMDIMGEYRIAPHKINLEITETASINAQNIISKNMSLLKQYGTSFSLDDYGSGYSNLTYILGMPLKIIKIDRSITEEYFKSEKARIATEYTIEMIHKLGLEIVVEGVETEEQYVLFKKLGVEYIQGYYFAKPIQENKVLEFIQEWM